MVKKRRRPELTDAEVDAQIDYAHDLALQLFDAVEMFELLGSTVDENVTSAVMLEALAFMTAVAIELETEADGPDVARGVQLQASVASRVAMLVEEFHQNRSARLAARGRNDELSPC